jgi:hypothetical protein
MKLSKILISEIEKISSLGYALDIGFGYPYELIEILHNFNATKCFGTDLKKENYAVSCSLVSQEISDKTNIPKEKIDYLIRDDEFKREFHNSYKLYTTFVLNKEPIVYGSMKSYLELHFEKSIQDYLKNENKSIQNYDIIIASKVLSHIDPESDENWEWVLDQLLNKLSDKGIIYLKLNSDDFKVEKNNGILDSTILSPFDKEKLNKILSKLDVISNQTLTREDGKREYEIIGKKNTACNKVHDGHVG